MDAKERFPKRNKLSLESIPATGLSVLYEPETDAPIVDIILVHGLKGHPCKTWTFKQNLQNANKQSTNSEQKTSKMSFSKKLEIRESIKALVKFSSSKRNNNDLCVFWPVDLLPTICENARVLTFGYDTKITKYTSGPTNMNSIFSHGKDFLFSLGRMRVPDRPLMFVAHSLGGILVKEMLALSSTSDGASLKGILECTAAIIFLGTPHRGSPELSAIGEWARSILDSFRLQTNSMILDALGLKTTDLQRVHEAFCRLWSNHDFQVKTFQESLGLTGINLGVLGNKVVPHDSSLIGDPKEEAETLQANHMEMSRFSSAEDPNFVKVGGEIRKRYRAIEIMQANHHRNLHRTDASGSLGGKLELPRYVKREEHEPFDMKMISAAIESLHFNGMDSRRECITPPSIHTGQWLFQNPTFLVWQKSTHARERLFFIKGKPGAGKSTLMKEAVRKTISGFKARGCCASFFVNARNSSPDSLLECSRSGVLRSLLYQLLTYYENFCIDTQSKPSTTLMMNIRGKAAISSSKWRDREMESLLIDVLGVLDLARVPVYIFVDAVDELGLVAERVEIEFWKNLVHSENFRDMRVCLSCRYYPHISTTIGLELFLDAYNSPDIFSYINLRFERHIPITEGHWASELCKKIYSLSSGVFLWVVLVVDAVCAKYDQGFGLQSLTRIVEETPKELNEVYGQVLGTLTGSERLLALRLFQWATESSRPLRLDEWHHVLAFLKIAPPKSLEEWRNSGEFTENDQQLERMIKSLSGGLLQISSSQHDPVTSKEAESSSVNAGAGSLDQEQGSARVVKLIHESVYNFLMSQGGFEILGWKGKNVISDCHCMIAITCLDYIGIPELDDLVIARQRMTMGDITPSSKRSSLFEYARELGKIVKGSGPKRTLEDLQSMPAIDTHTLVESWMANGHLSSCSSSIGDDAHISAVSESVGIKSQALQDYPALLLYAISELCYHISLAKAATSGHIKERLHHRLKDTTLRARLNALHAKLSLNDYIIPIKTDDRLSLKSSESSESSLFEREQMELFKRRIKERREADKVAVQGPRRPGSIASFGSASSYGYASSKSRRD
ncbi:hypothetical protein FOYG_12865 [Fusarium oxysporum NRRL 32931]|uniref:Nephrocystin 3-like N-terminal domain-containing protein n=1 Tax=Fusarium oxysporum NRRL 32931 TaxID=660029 RepID=W9HXK9_FUSOX|nr:hypothetical protein FOYG_12865 [Fusarium oxysporum NRRL 32931]